MFDGPVGWQIYFWLMSASIVLPLPWKLWEYARGKDKSPIVVKIEEMAYVSLFGAGLIGLYGYVHGITLANQTVWWAWLTVAGLWSLSALFWSPKLKYAVTIIGKKPTVALALAGTAMVAPLFVAIYLYATKT